MCGRLNVTDNEGVRLLMEMIGMPSWPSIQARYNVAPTANLTVLAPVLQNSPQNSPQNSQQNSLERQVPATQGDNSIGQAVTGHWGIIPAWARKGNYTRPLINARSETVWEKASFKKLIVSSRVVVPVTGFYEWKREKSTKTPYYFTAAQTPILLLAGICQNLESGFVEAGARALEGSDKTAEMLPQIAILTTAANDTMQDVHDRMPVILQPDDVETWLYGGAEARPVLDPLMMPAANDTLSRKVVSSFVNNARNEGPECIEPAA